MEKELNIDWEEVQRRVEEAQKDSMPKEDLTPYIGEWVALRHGYVVCNGLSPSELIAHPDYQQGDTLLPVPQPGFRA